MPFTNVRKYSKLLQRRSGGNETTVTWTMKRNLIVDPKTREPYMRVTLFILHFLSSRQKYLVMLNKKSNGDLRVPYVVKLLPNQKSPTCEVVGGEKEKFYSDVTQSGRMADSLSQSSFLTQNPGKAQRYSVRPKRKPVPCVPAPFYSNILWASWAAAKGSSRQLWLFLAAVHFQIPPAGRRPCSCKVHKATCSQERTQECTSSLFTRLAREREIKFPPGSHGPCGC